LSYPEFAAEDRRKNRAIARGVQKFVGVPTGGQRTSFRIAVADDAGDRELDYRLIKEVWTFHENRIAVRCAYEWHDDGGYWFRSYGNENWEFDEHGLMRLRIASINDVPIKESERKYRWPLGRRPDMVDLIFSCVRRSSGRLSAVPT
jgi:hypothetical protein